MQQRTANLFDLHDRTPGSWIVITTNGGLDRDGNLVMGAGVAGAAKRRIPGLERRLGALVAKHGNVPVGLTRERVLTWPTKPATHTLADGSTHPGWMCVARVNDPSCLDQVGRLTAASGQKLLALVERLEIKGPIFLPRPGCGLGGLDWRKVRPWMEERFDDRFVVVDPAR